MNHDAGSSCDHQSPGPNPNPNSTEYKALRILIAHTGDLLAEQDVHEILKFAWHGSMDADCKMTTHPVTHIPVSSDEGFAYEWMMWQQLLKHSKREHPYWEDHKIKPYQGTIVRTGQRFYLEIYY